jgi:HemY protein
MRGLLWFLAAFAVAVALSLILRESSYVVVVAPPWRIEISLLLAVLIAVAAFIVAHLLTRLVSHTLALPGYVQAFRARQLASKGRRSLTGALQSLYEGRYIRTEKLAGEAWKCGETRALACLVAARAAHARRDFARRDEWLERAKEAEPEWRAARCALQAELWIEERRFEEARGILRELHANGPFHLATLQLLLRCEQGLGNWEDTIRLARLLEKRQGMPREAAEGIIASARLAQLSRELNDSRALAETWRRIPAAEQLHPRVAATAARAFKRLGDARAARGILAEALDANWESELVELYGDCQGPDALACVERAEGWLAGHPDDSKLLLTLGRLCIQCELWGKAQSYLEASLVAEPTRAAHLALARLFDSIGRTEDANRHIRAGVALQGA